MMIIGVSSLQGGVLPVAKRETRMLALRRLAVGPGVAADAEACGQRAR